MKKFIYGLWHNNFFKYYEKLSDIIESLNNVFLHNFLEK